MTLTLEEAVSYRVAKALKSPEALVSAVWQAVESAPTQLAGTDVGNRATAWS